MRDRIISNIVVNSRENLRLLLQETNEDSMGHCHFLSELPDDKTGIHLKTLTPLL